MYKVLRIFVVISLVVFAFSANAQYNYLNKYIEPMGGIEAVGGLSSNMFIRNDTLLILAVYSNFGDYNLSFLKLTQEGEIVDTIINSTIGGYVLTNYADSYMIHDNGIIGAGSHNGYPWLVQFDYSLEAQYDYQYPLPYTDTLYSEFHLARLLQDGSYIAAGIITYDSIPEEPGQQYSNMLLVKFDSNHQILWQHEYPLYEDGIISGQRSFIRLNDMFEMSNGDLLIWGAWYHNWNPMVLRLSSEGEFIAHTTWGDETLHDWLPWPVRFNVNDFMFAGKVGTYTDMTGNYGKPSSGFFNAETMEMNNLVIYDHEYSGLQVTDFERTPDGGTIMLGYGYDDFSMGFSYLLKLDQNGNEEWFKKYWPDIDYATAHGLDLEVFYNGQIAFVGNFLVYHEDLSAHQNIWVVLTDPCGDLVYSGCPIITGTDDISANPKNTLSLYPNPTSSLLQSLNLPSGTESIEIYNTAGALVMIESVKKQNQLSLNITHLNSGLYFVIARSENGEKLAESRVVIE